MRRPLAAALATVAFFALAGTASASYDLIGSGSATLKLDPGFSKALDKSGIKLSGRGSAKVKGKAVTLLTAGGKADPTIKKAEIPLAGEVWLKKGKDNIRLRDITLKTKPTPIFARVGGGQLKFAKAAKVTLPRNGFGNDMVATKLKLTDKVATRLNKKLHVAIFSEGQAIGSLKATTQPKTVAILPSGLVTVNLDSAMVSKLNALSVSINPAFPAEHQGPVFTFPIALMGALAPDGKGGTLRTGGSMELLRLGAGQLFWKEMWFDLGVSAATSEESLEPAPFPGKLGRVPFVDVSVAGGQFSADPAARTMSVNGAAVTLQANTASLFNQGFAGGKEEFHPGELLGTVAFTAQSQ